MQCGVASCHQHKSPLSTAAPSSFKSGVVQAAGRTDLGSPAWLRVATGSPAYEHPRSLLLGACLARATQALLVTFAASSQFEGPRRYSRQQHSVRVCVDQRLPLDVYALIHVYAWINSRWSAVLPFSPSAAYTAAQAADECGSIAHRSGTAGRSPWQTRQDGLPTDVRTAQTVPVASANRK